MKRSIPHLLALGACLLAAPAAAQYEEVDPPNNASPDRKAEGKALADRGYELFQQGDYAGAIELFKQAEAISHSPMILNFLAESHERLGKLMQAATYYQQLADEDLPALAPPAARKAQADARTRVPLLQQRVPQVQFEFSGVPKEQIKVKLDERELSAAEIGTPIRMNPGRHVLNIRAPEREPVLRTFDARERQLTTFAMHFAPVPPTPEAEERVTVVREEAPSPIHIIGPSAAYGLGAGGLVLGIISGAMYLGRASSLTDRCPNDRCIIELEEERNTLSQLGTLATVGLIVGGVGVTTGTLWLLLAPDEAPKGDEAQTAWLPEVGVGPGTVTLSGRF